MQKEFHIQWPSSDQLFPRYWDCNILILWATNFNCKVIAQVKSRRQRKNCSWARTDCDHKSDEGLQTIASKLINADRWQNANMLQSIYVILHQWVQLDFTSCQLVVFWFNCYIKARLLIINVILLLNSPSVTTTLLFMEIFFLFQIYEVLARLWI